MRARILPFALVAFAAALAACADQDPPPQDQAPATEADAGSMAQALPEEPVVTDEPPMRRMPGSDEDLVRCDAEAARGAIGKEATAEVVEQARRDAGADVVRTLSPGQMVTMEFHSSRLNLDVDEANVVIDVRCG